jgi:FkbM family methyltransferase
MNKVKYYAQFGEDKILNEIFKKKFGICIEVGGFDGITGSNTYFFEKLGWRSIVIEPMPDFCERIKNSRNCEVIEIAASDKAGEVEFYVAAGVETLSTLQKDDEHFARIKSLSDKEIKKIIVKTERLDDILLKRGIADIDFITIDVEGHEMSVLSGMSFDKISPRILIIEDNSFGGDTKVKKLMESFAYVRFNRTGCNDWYAKKDDALITFSRVMQIELVIFSTVIWRRFKSVIKRIIRK